MRQSARIKLGGGGLNILTKDTILRGMGDFITDIDYDNIVNNRLIFEENDFIIEKTVKILMIIHLVILVLINFYIIAKMKLIINFKIY
jgi:hypothetical protein